MTSFESEVLLTIAGASFLPTREGFPFNAVGTADRGIIPFGNNKRSEPFTFSERCVRENEVFNYAHRSIF